VDDNVNLASFRTLLDGYEYAIYLWGKGKAKGQRPKAKGRGGFRIQDPKSKKEETPKTKAKKAAKSKPKAKTTAKAKPKAKQKTK
jgi:hypothetical protein